MELITAAIRARRPGLGVHVAYLDHCHPRVGAVVEALGDRRAVVVPMLLGNAFHGRVDVPGALRAALARHPAARVTQARVLGADPALLHALARRLEAAGADAADPTTGVVLASAGTSDPRARAALERLARHRLRPGHRVTVAYASGPGPTPGEAVQALRAQGAARVAVASWFLAAGLLYDRACADALAHGADVVAGVLGSSPEVVRLVLRRYDAALAAAAAPAA